MVHAGNEKAVFTPKLKYVTQVLDENNKVPNGVLIVVQHIGRADVMELYYQFQAKRDVTDNPPDDSTGAENYYEHVEVACYQTLLGRKYQKLFKQYILLEFPKHIVDIENLLNNIQKKAEAAQSKVQIDILTTEFQRSRHLKAIGFEMYRLKSEIPSWLKSEVFKPLQHRPGSPIDEAPPSQLVLKSKYSNSTAEKNNTDSEEFFDVYNMKPGPDGKCIVPARFVTGANMEDDDTDDDFYENHSEYSEYSDYDQPTDWQD